METRTNLLWQLRVDALRITLPSYWFAE